MRAGAASHGVNLQGSDPDGTGAVVQRIFGGLLQSDVICCACGHTSTSHDPFLDISLDIGVAPPLPPPLLRPPAPAFHRCVRKAKVGCLIRTCGETRLPGVARL